MSNLYSITDFGAQEGTLCTDAIQRAFDAASATQGTVVIPRGTYMSGTLHMGEASLCLERGAVLLGSPDPAHYPPTGFRHNEMHDTTCLLHAEGACGIRVYGEGTIDLNGSSFYNLEERIVPEYYPAITQAQRRECTATFRFRPSQPIFFHQCRDITFEGVTLCNAPCWTLSFNDCENIRITDLTIRNDRSLPNNDGMHFCSCRRVFVRGCNIEAGDDCIALSGITDWETPCEDIVISDCVLRSTSKAIVLGFIHSIVRHVTISNVIIRDSQRGLCIMSCAGSGLVEDVTVNNLQVETHIRAGNWWGNGEPICIFSLYHNNPHNLQPDPLRDVPVNIRSIRIANVCCDGENVIGIVGTGDNVRDIVVDGLTFTRHASASAHLKGVNVVDVSPAQEKAFVPDDAPCYWLCAQGCRDVTFRHVLAHGLKAYHRDCTNLILA